MIYTSLLIFTKGPLMRLTMFSYTISVGVACMARAVLVPMLDVSNFSMSCPPLPADSKETVFAPNSSCLATRTLDSASLTTGNKGWNNWFPCYIYLRLAWFIMTHHFPLKGENLDLDKAPKQLQCLQFLHQRTPHP